MGKYGLDKNAHVIKTLITILNASRATENAGKVKLQRWIMCRVKNVEKIMDVHRDICL